MKQVRGRICYKRGVGCHLPLLRRFINFGVKKHLCQGPPFIIEMPKASSLKTEDLTPEQLSRLLEAINEASNIQGRGLYEDGLVYWHEAGRAISPAVAGH